MSPETEILNAQYLTIKVGSSLLVNPKTKSVNSIWVKTLVEDIVALRKKNIKVIIVTSGAVALGLSQLSIKGKPSQLEQAQAAAAIGQVKLLEAYKSPFNANKIEIAQLLLTLDDLENRSRYINARNTLEVLLENNIIPIINENDTVATSELRFGDNDCLAAKVALMSGSESLILLSDIDGFYSEDPKINSKAQFFKEIDVITSEMERMAGPPTVSGYGSGGMATKLKAAKIASSGGCSTIVMNGHKDHPIKRLLDGEKATIFKTSSDNFTVRKSWIRGLVSIKGKIYIDQGAVNALKGGSSLLGAGITKSTGDFLRGDLVGIFGQRGVKLGQGLIAYNSIETGQICGRKSDEIIDILGYAGRSAVIHRNDLVLV